MENKVILIISPDDWDFVQVSKHLYAIELAKNNSVYFLNPPSRKKTFVDKSVTIISSYLTIRGVGKINNITLQRFLMKKVVKNIQSKINRKIDIVWSFDSSRLFYLDLFNAPIKIAHLVDFRENIYLSKLAKSSDICIGTSNSILKQLSLYTDKIFKIQHGYVESEIIDVPNLPGENAIKGVYIGNLNIEFLDWEVVLNLANNFENVDFVFIGPINNQKKETIESHSINKNVKFVKPIDASMIGSYLEKGDFCLQTYDIDLFPEQLENPHKTMQYLGSSKPIFSSFTLEYSFDNLLFEYKEKENVLLKFSEFLNGLIDFSNKENSDFRRNYALSNRYENQISRIEQVLIKENLLF